MGRIDAEKVDAAVAEIRSAELETGQVRCARLRSQAPVLQPDGRERAVAVSETLPGSHLVECRCAACRAGDALPLHLQGIPGAKQLTFIQPGKASMTPHEKRLREECRDSCAEYGDPPCFELDSWAGDPTYCVDCRGAAGEDVSADPQPLDDNAVVRPLL